MKSRSWFLLIPLVLALARGASGQQFVPVQTDASGGVFSLMPVGGTDVASPFAATDGPPLDMRAKGTVGGRGAAGLGDIEIGFDYIRPFWTSRDFILAVPAANAGSFPLLGNIGHVDNHFALAPRVNYKYDVSDYFAIKATGSFLNLTGQLERTLAPADGSLGILTANSSLTIVTANVPEVSTRFNYDELFSRQSHLYWSIFDDLTIDLSLGTRYSSIEQNYSGKLNNSVPGGKNETQRYSYQSFKGIGITSALNFTLPVHQNWDLFTNLRGSVLVGNNRKDSSLSVNVVGMPGVSTSINQNKTEYIPIGEVEMGAQWVHEFGDVLRPGLPPALFTVRVGVSGQFWGNVGPLSAGSTQGFATSNLFLAGTHIMVGLHR